MFETAVNALATEGFDLVHAFDAEAAAREPGLGPLRDPTRRLGLLIGNTRALWPRFVAAVRTEQELAGAAHPLERYTERVVDQIAATLPRARWWFGHRRYDGEFLPFQRLAVATAFGALAPTHLVIHPTYGPWFALRAVIICQGDPPAPPPRLQRSCSCEGRCETALSSALAATGSDRWRAWLAVRDACPIGREYRYSEPQLTYHYTGQKTVLVSDTGLGSPSGTTESPE